ATGANRITQSRRPKLRQYDTWWRSMRVPRAYCARNSGVGLCWDRNRRKRRSVDPKDLRSLRMLHRQAYSIVGPAQTFRYWLFVRHRVGVPILRTLASGLVPAVSPLSRRATAL